MVRSFHEKIENLAAGVDITARAFRRMEFDAHITRVVVLPEAASVGVDGANTLVVTLRNITKAEDIASVTRTTNTVANTPVALTVTEANADVNKDDVIGLVVTQGVTADAGVMDLQADYVQRGVGVGTGPAWAG